MMKITINEPKQPALVSAEEFVKMPVGTVGVIVGLPGDTHHNVLVQAGSHGYVYVVGRVDYWTAFDNTNFQIRLLPKGTQIVLEVE